MCQFKLNGQRDKRNVFFHDLFDSSRSGGYQLHNQGGGREVHLLAHYSCVQLSWLGNQYARHAKCVPDPHVHEGIELRIRLRIGRFADDRGHYLVEFTFSILPLLILIFGVIEVSRMVLVYNTIAHAARAGVRYAIVHGSDSAASKSQIQTVVTNFLSAAPMNAGSVTPTVTYQQKGTPAVDCTDPGCTVTVSVVYSYDPLTMLIPLSVNLSSTSEGVIVF